MIAAGVRVTAALRAIVAEHACGVGQIAWPAGVRARIALIEEARAALVEADGTRCPGILLGDPTYGTAECTVAHHCVGCPDEARQIESVFIRTQAANRARDDERMHQMDLEEEQRQAAKVEYALHAEFLAIATEMLSGLDAESQRRAYEPCSSFAKLRALRILSVLLRRAPRKYDVFPTRYAEVAIGTEQAPCRRILILCGRTGGVTCFVSDDYSDSRRAHYDDDTTLPDAFMIDAIRALDVAPAEPGGTKGEAPCDD